MTRVAAPLQVTPARGAGNADEGDAGGSSATVALLTVLPFGLAAAWMLLLAKSSQKSGAQHHPRCTQLGPGPACMHLLTVR